MSSARPRAAGSMRAGPLGPWPCAPPARPPRSRNLPAPPPSWKASQFIWKRMRYGKGPKRDHVHIMFRHFCVGSKRRFGPSRSKRPKDGVSQAASPSPMSHAFPSGQNPQIYLLPYFILVKRTSQRVGKWPRQQGLPWAAEFQNATRSIAGPGSVAFLVLQDVKDHVSP